MASSNQPTMDQPNASTTDSKIPSQSISASCSASARAAEHLVVGRSEGARRAHSLSPRQSRRTKASNPRRPHSLKERRKPIGDITNVTNTDDNVFAKPVSVPKKVRNKKAIGRRSPRHADRASLSRSLQHEEAGHNSSDSPHTEETSEDTESSPSLTSYSEETAQEGRPREAYYEDVTAASSSLEDPAYSQVQTSIFSLRATSSTCISIAQDPTELAAAPGHHCYRCIFRQSTRARPVCHLCLKLNPRSHVNLPVDLDQACGHENSSVSCMDDQATHDRTLSLGLPSAGTNDQPGQRDPGDPLVCQICETGRLDTVLLYCLHVTVCRRCVRALQCCPFCGHFISAVKYRI